ncbi:MAG TPA: ABC transporter permease [Candidatus Udaeobacter sp.]|jgi:putative ABC transport system permease protein
MGTPLRRDFGAASRQERVAMLEKLYHCLKAKFRALFQRRTVERELASELQNHIEAKIRQLTERGMTPSEARTMTLREFGGIEQRKEECRDVRGLSLLEDLWRDVRFAGCALIKNGTFAVVATLTIALGIGANTAIFTLVHGVLLRSLPLPDADRLVAIGEASPSGNLTALPYENFRDWRSAQHSFEEMAARLPAGGIITGIGEPERVFGRYVSAGFFSTLQVSPQIGRFFNEAEDKLGGEHVTIISDSLWHRRFAGDPGIIGQAIRYNGDSWTVIGVLQSDFDFYGQNNENNDVFMPLGQLDQQDSRGRGYPVRITARLKANVSEEQARAEIKTLAQQSALKYPQSDSGHAVDLRSLLSDYVGESTRSLTVISVAVAVLLIIACANVANLTLARAINRQKEIALRVALGASRFRIIRLLLVESILVAAIGGILGVGLASWAIHLFKSAAPGSLPRLSEISPSGTVLAVTVIGTLLSGIVFGLAPARQTTRFDLNQSLKASDARASGSPGSERLRRTLVIVEFALAFILLIASGLLVKSFRNLMTIDRGYDAKNVLSFRLRLADMKYPRPEQAILALKEAQRRLRTLPEVKNVAVTTAIPLGRFSEGNYWIEGRSEPQNIAQWPLSTSMSVSEEYRDALGIKLLAGRWFDQHDQADSPLVVVVDDQFVGQNFGAVTPASILGRRLRFEGADEPWREIVGVVGHVRYHEPEEEPLVQIYRPWLQMNLKPCGAWLCAMDVVIKTSVDPWTILPAVRKQIAALDPDQPLGPAHTFEEMLDQSIAPRRLNLALISAFSASALLLSAVGIYGVMSYTVGQRRREIGVRIALGAQKRDVAGLVIGSGMTMVGLALIVGIGGAFAVTRFMSGLLFGVEAADVATYAIVAVLLAGVALCACYVPARRAGNVNPLEALRSE